MDLCEFQAMTINESPSLRHSPHHHHHHPPRAHTHTKEQTTQPLLKTYFMCVTHAHANQKLPWNWSDKMVVSHQVGTGS